MRPWSCSVLLALLALSAPASGLDVIVTFMASPAALPKSPGHAFVCMAYPSPMAARDECSGFYPKDPLHPFSGEGVVEDELSRAKHAERFASVTVKLDHAVSEETRDALRAEIQKWKVKTGYNVITHNCGDMLFAVAKVAGLTLPERTAVMLPTEFVEGLRKRYWSGLWTSTDPNSRFSLLRAAADTITWTERSSGVTIEKTVPFSPDERPVTIYRENTADVLEVLGYQPTIRAEILAAQPKPSYLKLVRRGRSIEAEWYGLVAIKDVRAHLKELRQPGSTPGRAYTFDHFP